jgi:hypothetical protein
LIKGATGVDSEFPRKGKYHPEPGAWRGGDDDDCAVFLEEFSGEHSAILGITSGPREQAGLLELLGLINYRILSGHSLYIEVNGAIYKILYGGYWRSVFTGVEHYFLRCDELAEGKWLEGCADSSRVDLAILQTSAGWLVKGRSLKFMAYEK